MKKVVLIILVSFSLALTLFIVLGSKSNSTDSKVDECSFLTIDLQKGSLTLNLKDFVVEKDSIKSKFPAEAYGKCLNWKTTKGLLKDLSYLDSLGVPDYDSDYIINEVLTTQLKERWESNNLDTLNAIVHWAIPFLHVGQSGQKHSILFQAVGDYWLGNVSERLQDLVKKDEFIFINCKHRFLRMQVCQLQYTCGDKLPDGVKIINNLGDSKWGYLWERFWTHTSSIQKIVIVTVLMFNLYLLFFFLKIKLTKKQS